MGSKSKSSSSSTNLTNQEDNRIAATDNAIAVGRGGSFDASQSYANSPITITSTQTTSDADVAGAFSDALARSMREVADLGKASLQQSGETSRAAISSNRDVAGQGLDLAGAIADDGFEITTTVVDLLGKTAREVTSEQTGKSYDFAGRVLEGYEQARLDEGERKFNQVMSMGTAVAIAALIAWAYVKGR